MKKHKVFSTLIDNKKDSYGLIMTSVLIAVGVNLLSTGIVELFGFQYKEIVLIVLGVLLSIGVIAKIAKMVSENKAFYFIWKTR